jgi:hypothetical protein
VCGTLAACSFGIISQISQPFSSIFISQKTSQISQISAQAKRPLGSHGKRQTLMVFHPKGAESKSLLRRDV